MPTLKHKVTLREKHAEVITPSKEPTTKHGNNWWIWFSIIIVVLLLCVGAYFLLNKEDEEIIQPTEVTELVTSQPGEDNEIKCTPFLIPRILYLKVILSAG